ncbi:LTA synthase family protein [Aerococcaceae bacterium zg-ZUI334]|uniref:LTA synthase family protein n=1 Tax=Aerococcaceae bacterium zg-252 TaxID=2796928 RepID=UPI001B9FC900|nr:LTA synthase family protein [Aerococcaceae bacterium zg-ZUI334]
MISIFILFGASLYVLRPYFHSGLSANEVTIVSKEKEHRSRQWLKDIYINNREITQFNSTQENFSNEMNENKLGVIWKADETDSSISIKVSTIEKISFEYFKDIFMGEIVILVDGKEYQRIDSFSEEWGWESFQLDLPKSLAITKKNYLFYLIYLIAGIMTYLFFTKKVYENIRVKELFSLSILSLLILSILISTYLLGDAQSVKFLGGEYLSKKSIICLMLFLEFALYIMNKVLATVSILNNRTYVKVGYHLMLMVLVAICSTRLIESGYSNVNYMLPGKLSINVCILFLILLPTVVNSRLFKLFSIMTFMLSAMLGIINDRMIFYRGQVISMQFLKQLKMFGTIANNYHITLEEQHIMVITYALFLIMMLMLITTRYKLEVRQNKFKLKTILCFVIISFFSYFSITTIVSKNDIHLSYWRMQDVYRSNGFLLSHLKYRENEKIEKPKGYSEEKVSNILSQYKNFEPHNKKWPNIIIIQNESQADYSPVKDLKFSEDPFRFENSLVDNTVKGSLYVSVQGGGTANTEYEVLTSNTLASGIRNVFPFQTIIKNDSHSIVDYLNSLGYLTVGMHPFSKDNYNRFDVYHYLGFDKVYFLDNDTPIDDIADVNFERSFVSDESLFKGIMELHKQKDDQPLFAFAVTMQGHGGYQTQDYQTEVGINMENALEEEVYFTLMKKTDNAFEDLINYFQKIDEPTIVIMYGDHQPTLSQGFYSKFMENLPYSDRYRTPFVLWANFDISEEQNTILSPNFIIPTLLSKLKNSDNPLPINSYYQFLIDVMEEYPVYTTWGFKEKTDKYSETIDTELYQEYMQVQYNKIFGTYPSKLFLP